ncbi:MAG: hypothetical protein ACRDFS_04420 [Chloroflexota bacterium]
MTSQTTEPAFSPATGADMSPVSRQHDPILLLAAILISLVWVFDQGNGKVLQPGLVALLLIGALIALLAFRRWRYSPALTLGFTLLVTLSDRVPRTPYVGSDVMATTREAIAALFSGHDPYTHVYLTSNPAGAPMPYLPGETLFYAIPQLLFGRIQVADHWTGIGVVILLAALAPLAGWGRSALLVAIYGAAGFTIQRSLDGSNDTSLAFLIILAVVLLAASRATDGRTSAAMFWLSATFAAWALLFKELSWLVFMPLALGFRLWEPRWRAYLGVALGVPALVLLAFFLWSPTGFMHNVGGGLTYHSGPSGLNLWALLYGLWPHASRFLLHAAPFLEAAVALGLTGVAAPRPPGGLGAALLAGAGVLTAVLLVAGYSTGSYFALDFAVASAGVCLLGWDSRSGSHITSDAAPAGFEASGGFDRRM